MSNFGALTGVSSVSGVNHLKERDLNETAGPVAPAMTKMLLEMT